MKNRIYILGYSSIQARQPSSIQTSPILRDYHLATSYVGLQLTFQFNQTPYEECSWYFGDWRVILSAKPFNEPCFEEDNQTNYTLTCSGTDGSITSSLTVLLAAVTSVPVRVGCQRDLAESSTFVELDSFNLNVTGMVKNKLMYEIVCYQL